MSRAVVEADKSPKLIPRVIHQTYKSSSVPADLKVFMHSWRRLNEDWEIRFYDDEACINFVQWEFPEYLDAYRSLETNVERSDFFRRVPLLSYLHSAFQATMLRMCMTTFTRIHLKPDLRPCHNAAKRVVL